MSSSTNFNINFMNNLDGFNQLYGCDFVFKDEYMFLFDYLNGSACVFKEDKLIRNFNQIELIHHVLNRAMFMLLDTNKKTFLNPNV